jgi:6-phosphogluconolactonase
MQSIPLKIVNKQSVRLNGAHILKRTVTVAALFCAWLFAVPVSQAAELTKDFDVLVGTYTSGTSKGIYSFRFSAETGNLQPLATSAETANPSYLVVSPDEKFVYAVNELHGCGNEQGAVSAFHFDAASGALTFINKVPSVGEDPCYISLSPDGENLFVANYSTGSLSALAVQADGSLAGPVETLPTSDMDLIRNVKRARTYTWSCPRPTMTFCLRPT